MPGGGYIGIPARAGDLSAQRNKKKGEVMNWKDYYNFFFII